MSLRFLTLLATLLLMSCASSPKSFDETFSRSEIAHMTSGYFDLDSDAAVRALKPTYQKYGAPHIYVSGLMSAVVDDTIERLHGTGQTARKLALPDTVYWAIQGKGLPTQTRPIKTAHLIYNKVEIEDIENALSSIGKLSRRGQVFTVFERETDGQIVVTLNLTDDLGETAELETVRFFPL